MDSRKELTKRLIADSFKALLCRYPFDKISIMMIANESDIRRPSFYNHFQDKYDLLEWIVAEDVIAPSQEELRRGEVRAAAETFFRRLQEDALFYRRAFAVTGQNGFEEAFTQRMTAIFAAYIPDDAELPPPLTKEDTAHFYAVCCVNFAKNWLERGRESTPEALAEAYFFLLRHSIRGLNRKKNHE